MNSTRQRLLLISILCLFTRIILAAQPQISSLLPGSAPLGGRFKINGINFGFTRGNGIVRVGDALAPVSRWSDTQITAYLTDETPLGRNDVQVITDGGSSNVLPITVTERAPREGRVNWRFMADSDRVESQPAIGPDGRIYVQDLRNVYALSPDGGVQWIFNANNGAYKGRISVASDGVIYAGFGSTVYAIDPDGTKKWSFTDTSGAAIVCGPTVGPDGNIYAVTEDFGLNGLGLFALSPSGTLLWNRTGFLTRFGFHGETILFGPSDDPTGLFFTVNALGGYNGGFFRYDLNGDLQWEALASGYPAMGPDGTLYTADTRAQVPDPKLQAFDPNDGHALWTHFGSEADFLTNPDVGPDGTIYIGFNLTTLVAVNADSTERWRTNIGGILSDPALSPRNDLLVLSGYAVGQSGFIVGLGTDGQIRFTIPLPREGGVPVWPAPFNRARFTMDGCTAYVGTARAEYSDPYSFLYALDTCSE